MDLDKKIYMQDGGDMPGVPGAPTEGGVDGDAPSEGGVPAEGGEETTTPSEGGENQ